MNISPVRNNFISQRINKPKQQSERLVDSSINNKECKQYSNTYYNHFNYIPFNGALLNSARFENPLYDYDFRDFVSKEGKVTLAEYQEIKQKQPKLLKHAETFISLERKKIGMFQTPEDTAKLVAKIQECFDNVFGENSYVIVSIGTSPAFVTESLSAMGKNVIFLPVSRVNCLISQKDFQRFFKEFPKTEIVADYLKEKLSEQDLENKKIIMLDYKSSGRTLEFLNNIAENYCEISPSQIYTCDIVQLIKEIVNTDDFRLSPEEYQFDIGHEKVALVANITHYPVDEQAALLFHWSSKYNDSNERKCYRNFENYSRKLGRAYQLLVLDELEKMKSS